MARFPERVSQDCLLTFRFLVPRQEPSTDYWKCWCFVVRIPTMKNSPQRSQVPFCQHIFSQFTTNNSTIHSLHWSNWMRTWNKLSDWIRKLHIKLDEETSQLHQCRFREVITSNERMPKTVVRTIHQEPHSHQSICRILWKTMTCNSHLNHNICTNIPSPNNHL